MDEHFLDWDDFLTKYRAMSSDDRRRTFETLEPEQQRYFRTLWEEDQADDPGPLSLRFKDFEPRELSAPVIWGVGEYEPLGRALARLNRWVEKSGVEVVNVETVVLPNMHRRHEEGTIDPMLSVNGEYYARWHQFLRVWYRPGSNVQVD
ncbi:MAG: hypothetical protein AAFY88_16615 [Acidobacteriota bacterium]